MLEKYLQLSKEKNKLIQSSLKHETTKENLPYVVCQLLAFIAIIPVLILNILFSFDLFKYKSFLENNGFGNFLHFLRNPSLFNEDFSFIYNETNILIIQKYEYITNVNYCFLIAFVFLFIGSVLSNRKISKNKKDVLYNSFNFNFQFFYVFSFFLFFMINSIVKKDINNFLPVSEISLLDESHHAFFSQLYYSIQTIGYMHALAFVILPSLLILMGVSIKNILKNIKTNKLLNESQHYHKVKKEIIEHKIEIAKLKSIILSNNDERNNILNKLKETHSDEEHFLLMELINSEINCLSDSEQKFELFIKNNHEVNHMENI